MEMVVEVGIGSQLLENWIKMLKKCESILTNNTKEGVKSRRTEPH